MLTENKKRGRPLSFDKDVEVLIAKNYLIDGLTAPAVADRFRPLSKSGQLSPSGVRAIADRLRPELEKQQGASPAQTTPR